MSDGKWIAGLLPTVTVRFAAEMALTIRLDVVRRYLPLAVHAAEKDMEYVHQLRVATRRTGAALKLFESSILPKRLQAIKRLLRRLRRTAGEARDYDVFQTTLAEQALLQSPQGQATFYLLSGFTTAQRMAAQQKLIDVSKGNSLELELTCHDLSSYFCTDNTHPTLVDLAFDSLQKLFRRLDQATNPVPTKYDDLHQVRILGKRIRYAMELFVGCFDPSFREKLYSSIEQMQEILGQANDSFGISERLTIIRRHLQAYQPTIWSTIQPVLEELIQYHKDQLPIQRKKFEEWLPTWQQTKEQYRLEDLLLAPLSKSFQTPSLA